MPPRIGRQGVHGCRAVERLRGHYEIQFDRITGVAVRERKEEKKEIDTFTAHGYAVFEQKKGLVKGFATKVVELNMT